MGGVEELVSAQAFGKFDLDGGELFMDGSCFLPAHPKMAHARANAIQLDQQGSLVKVATFPLPGWLPQTANYAEHVALSMGDALAEPGLVGVSDCQSVVGAHGKGVLISANMWAGHSGMVGRPTLRSSKEHIRCWQFCAVRTSVAMAAMRHFDRS